MNAAKKHSERGRNEPKPPPASSVKGARKGARKVRAFLEVRRLVNEARITCAVHRVCARTWDGSSGRRREFGRLGGPEREIAADLVVAGDAEDDFFSWADPLTIARRIGLSHGTTKSGLVRLDCCGIVERRYTPHSSIDSLSHHRHEYRIILPWNQIEVIDGGGAIVEPELTGEALEIAEAEARRQELLDLIAEKGLSSQVKGLERAPSIEELKRISRAKTEAAKRAGM